MAYDTVVAALSEVAAIMFPAAYEPDVHVGGQSLPNPAVVRQLYPDKNANTVYARARDAISHDPELAPLLGEREPSLAEHPDDFISGAFIHTDTGTGWRIQSQANLPGAFVQTAANEVLAKGRPTDSIEPLLEELGRVVLLVRRLVAGERCDATVLTAFNGIGIAKGATLETPWGLLRAASQFEREQRPFGGPPPTAILVTAVPIQWTLGEDGNTTISKELETISTHADLLALTGLLALGREAPLQWLWRTNPGPLKLGTGYSGRANSSPNPFWGEPPMPEPLTDEQAAALVTWSGRVAQSYHPSIAVAVRRTLSAVSERRFSAEDALIDAVIAWENLFGTGSRSEMTFRITTALAILLQPEPSARPSLRSELSKVYGLRSKVAHGGVVEPKDQLGDRKDRAIDVAIQALRILFEGYPSLLSNPERGMHIILGLPGE